MPQIRLENATKYYKVERKKHAAVSGINLTVEQGEFVFLIGSSGAGKSTVLKLLGGDISPNEGAAFLDGVNMNRFIGPWNFRLRRAFGYVWQEPRLMRKRTVLENLTMAARSGGLKENLDPAVAKALSLVGMVGAEHVYPAELSIGQSRRIELARALVCSPPVLLLDELTANMGDDNIWDIFHLLNELNVHGTTIIMATHASKYVNILRKRVITFRDGKLIGDVQQGRYGDISEPPKRIFITKK